MFELLGFQKGILFSNSPIGFVLSPPNQCTEHSRVLLINIKLENDNCRRFCLPLLSGIAIIESKRRFSMHNRVYNWEETHLKLGQIFRQRNP